MFLFQDCNHVQKHNKNDCLIVCSASCMHWSLTNPSNQHWPGRACCQGCQPHLYTVHCQPCVHCSLSTINALFTCTLFTVNHEYTVYLYTVHCSLSTMCTLFTCTLPHCHCQLLYTLHLHTANQCQTLVHYTLALSTNVINCLPLPTAVHNFTLSTAVHL